MPAARNKVSVTYVSNFIGQSSLLQCASMGTRFAYNKLAFDSNVLFNMPNDYPYYDLSAIPII